MKNGVKRVFIGENYIKKKKSTKKIEWIRGVTWRPIRDCHVAKSYSKKKLGVICAKMWRPIGCQHAAQSKHKKEKGICVKKVQSIKSCHVVAISQENALEIGVRRAPVVNIKQNFIISLFVQYRKHLYIDYKLCLTTLCLCLNKNGPYLT